AVAFYRIFLASLLLAPFAAGSARRSWPALSSRPRALLLASGVALGVHFATWIASLSFTSVAASVLLVNTTPLFTLAFSRAFLGYPPRTYAFLLALAVVPTLGGHGLVNRSLRLLSAPTVGLFLLGEPVGATVLAYLLFHEVPGVWTLAGGVVVLAALMVVVVS